MYTCRLLFVVCETFMFLLFQFSVSSSAASRLDAILGHEGQVSRRWEKLPARPGGPHSSTKNQTFPNGNVILQKFLWLPRPQSVRPPGRRVVQPRQQPCRWSRPPLVLRAPGWGAGDRVPSVRRVDIRRRSQVRYIAIRRYFISPTRDVPYMPKCQYLIVHC